MSQAAEYREKIAELLKSIKSLKAQLDALGMFGLSAEHDVINLENARRVFSPSRQPQVGPGLVRGGPGIGEGSHPLAQRPTEALRAEVEADGRQRCQDQQLGSQN